MLICVDIVMISGQKYAAIKIFHIFIANRQLRILLSWLRRVEGLVEGGVSRLLCDDIIMILGQKYFVIKIFHIASQQIGNFSSQYVTSISPSWLRGVEGLVVGGRAEVTGVQPLSRTTTHFADHCPIMHGHWFEALNLFCVKSVSFHLFSFFSSSFFMHVLSIKNLTKKFLYFFFLVVQTFVSIFYSSKLELCVSFYWKLYYSRSLEKGTS